MELRIKADIEQIRKVVPIIDEMIKKSFIVLDKRFIVPFQYGDSPCDVAILRCTQSGNIIMDNFSDLGRGDK